MRLSNLSTIALFVALGMAGCSQPSGEIGDVDLPRSFDRAEYLAKHFGHLDDYCELLEHLYAEPDSDLHVIAEVERLVSSKILLARTISMDASELDRGSVRALLKVLDLAENDRFGVELSLPLILDPSVEYLQLIRGALEERQEYLRSQLRY